MLHLVVYLVNQSIPILDLPVALLVEVGRHGYVVEEHGIEVEGVIWTDEGKDAGGSVSGPAFLDGKMEVSVKDGTTMLFHPGDVLLAEDMTGQGHITKSIDGTYTSVSMGIPD